MSHVSARIAQVLAIDPTANAIEFEGEWITWGQVADIADRAAKLVEEPGAEVGLLMTNTPETVGQLLGVLRAGGCVVTINPNHKGDRGQDPATSVRPGVAVRMLTSGTTGPPKRVDLTYDTLERVLIGAAHYGSTNQTSTELRRGVAIVNAPLVHLGGLFRVLSAVTDGRSFALLDRFTIEGWSDAVRRHRPATASLVPAAVRMVLEADFPPEDLSSLRSVICGTAPLDPDDADAFFTKYGVPVLVNYAATEFGGGVAGWNLEDFKNFWATKRGSAGRAHAGTELRVVDGQLEVKAVQLGGKEWVRTTDLARIDEDGFLWILGRADQAINRGGFKVIPEDVKAALERHSSVRSAAVVGRDDRRLGAVPVAAVELKADVEPISSDDLLVHAASLLTRYELPTEIRIVEALPRTDSGKADLVAVSALFKDS